MVRICALGFHVFCEWSVKRNCLSDRWKEQYVNEEYAHCCFFQHFHMTTTHKWEKCIACIFVHGSCHSKDAGVGKPLLRQIKGSEHHGKEGERGRFPGRAMKQGGIQSQLHLDGCLWRPSVSQEPQPVVWWRPQCSFCLTPPPGGSQGAH